MASWCVDDKPVCKCYMWSIFGCGFTEQAHLFAIRYFTLRHRSFMSAIIASYKKASSISIHKIPASQAQSIVSC